MSLTATPPEEEVLEPPERFDAAALAADQKAESERAFKEWLLVGIGLVALLAMLAIILSLTAFAQDNDNSSTGAIAHSAPSAQPAQLPAGLAPAPKLAAAKGMNYEHFRPVDPTLPAVPSGPVKKFTVSVDQHVVQVSPDLAPVEAWTYTVNGKSYPGTAASPPMVVNQGDKVQITFVNGTAKDGVNMAHSIDVHAAELAPNLNYIDVAPGAKKLITFTAKYPGVFMYHCATQPVLMHTGAGMTGMLVVKPHGLPTVAKELWVVQGEYYIGQPGGLADIAKMQAENPDVVAFNGYANQYKYAPISVPVGQPIRMYVLNTGPSKWSAFHVIGTLFDTVDEEGVISHGAQTISLAPSQGAVVTFTLPEAGNYSFVTHNFGDMVKGAAGVLHSAGAPAVKLTGPAPTGGSMTPVLPSQNMSAASAKPVPTVAGAVSVTVGDMWVKTPTATAKAGKVTFSVANQGQMPHQFGIVRAPAQLKNGLLASPVLAQSAVLNNGDAATVSAKLTAGSYELVCLMPGHYAAGQHTAFSVTG